MFVFSQQVHCSHFGDSLHCFLLLISFKHFIIILSMSWNNSEGACKVMALFLGERYSFCNILLLYLCLEVHSDYSPWPGQPEHSREGQNQHPPVSYFLQPCLSSLNALRCLCCIFALVGQFPLAICKECLVDPLVEDKEGLSAWLAVCVWAAERWQWSATEFQRNYWRSCCTSGNWTMDVDWRTKRQIILCTIGHLIYNKPVVYNWSSSL